MSGAVVRLGAYSSDPPACDAFHSFDPESYVVISAINDSLVYIDAEGQICPGLAVSWTRLDPVTVEFKLRRGVSFHNGEPFDADAVVATMAAHRDPANRSPTGQGILGIIKDCRKIDAFTVHVETAVPDGMFLHRLHLFSAIYPAGVLTKHGPGPLLDHPIGTGAFMFERWDRGREIVLKRNPHHWAAKTAVAELRFPIIRQKDWVDALASRHLDLAININPHDAARIKGRPELTITRRDAAISQWFLLAQHGPLANKRIRQALNLAVHRPLLATIADHGWAAPQAALATPGQVGYDAELSPYPYDPDLALKILKEEGFGQGFKLKGLVSDSSSSVYQLVREFLARIGVELEAEIVPRGEWMMQVVVARAMGQAGFAGDFVLSNVDNPLLHGLFHHFIFLFSQGPFAQIKSAPYDQRFLDAATTVDPAALETKLQALDRYAHDEALLLFTIRQQAYCAARKGYDMPLSRSGHFNYANLWQLTAPSAAQTPADAFAGDVPQADADLQKLLEATSYPGLLYGAAAAEKPGFAALRRNIELSQRRWETQTGAMIRTLVDQVSTGTSFANVMRSTRQVGIYGVTDDQRVLFENAGYREVVGHAGSVPLESILVDDKGAPVWNQIRSAVARDGRWDGVVNVRAPQGAKRRLFLTATAATNEVGANTGVIGIFADYSSEEERLRMKAEAATAALVQKALIPQVGATDLDVSAHYAPATETGGDFYHIRDGKEHLTILIGDVTGHGTPAAFVTASVAGAVRVLDVENEPLEGLLRKLNGVVASSGFGEYYMTMSVMRVAKKSRRYQLASAGHHSPLRAAPTDGVMKVEALPANNGPRLGHGADGRWPESDGVLAANTCLCFYTDGIVEGVNPAGQEFGFARLRRFFQESRGSDTTSSLIAGLVAKATEFYAGEALDDDLSLVLCKIP